MKNKNKNINTIALESLSMDLLRVAIGINRKSFNNADRFLKEAIKRKNEVNNLLVKPYLRKILQRIENLEKSDKIKKAEDSLMYSTLIRNYCQKFL